MQDSLGSRLLVLLGYLIIGVVREECLFWGASSCGESSRRGEVHPKVSIRCKGDKEGLHRIVVSDFIVFLSLDGDELSFGFFIVGMNSVLSCV